MDLSDLESKVLGSELGTVPANKAVKKQSQSKPAPKPKKEAAPKPEKKSKRAPTPKPAPAPKPTKVEPPKPAPKPKKEKAQRAPKVVPAPVPVAPVKKIAPPKTPAAQDSLAKPVGIAAGAAPLLLTPVVLLGAGRNVLSGTKARREKIQEEMALKAKAQKKKLVKDTSVDGGALTQALVSTP